MKCFALIFLALILSTCSSKQDKISIKPLTPLDSESELTLVEEHQVYLHDIGPTKIKLLKIKDWNDPGDIHKIEITNKRGTNSYSNMDGWVKFDDNYQVPKELKEMNELKSDKILVVTNEKYTLAILFGWVYASEPGLCTIINLTTGELEYNDNKDLISISADKRTFKVKDETSTEDIIIFE